MTETNPVDRVWELQDHAPPYTPETDTQDGNWFYVAPDSHLTRPVHMEGSAMQSAFPHGWPALASGWHYELVPFAEKLAGVQIA